MAAPWPLYNRPSIQLGALKAYLAQADRDLAVDAYYFYLQIAAAIGYRDYAAVSERSWLAEPVYAALLYPEKTDTSRQVFLKELRRTSPAKTMNFNRLIEKVGAATDRFVAAIQWDQYLLVGVTVSLCQLTATLYLTREIKRRFPGVPIVVGGSSAAGASGRGLVSAFSWIDFAVQGEGEQPLLQLVQAARSGALASISDAPAIFFRGNEETRRFPKFDQLETLHALPPPDYADYFKLLKGFAVDKRFFPVVPVETSRGCWWQKKLSCGHRGCAFCNLNTQWAGYRTKKAAHFIAELDTLKHRHQLLNFSFTDNALPAKTARQLFTTLAAAGHDYSFFGEIRASTDFKTLAAMRQAGLDTVQIGIEALSTRLLHKLNKGTTAIENIEIMKHCEELGIENRSNLIIRFPGADDDDVAQTLRAIEFAQIFRPLKPVRFWLGLGSPVCSDPTAYGITSHFNHPHYAALFPREICDQVPFIIRAYRGGQGRQAKLWAPVLQRIKAWDAAYARLKARSGGQPLLSYQDGGDFILIRQLRADGRPNHHRLTGSSREIYLFCRHHRGIKAIENKFPGFTRVQIKGFLVEMVAKKLMFSDAGRYLSLAVRTP